MPSYLKYFYFSIAVESYCSDVRVSSSPLYFVFFTFKDKIQNLFFRSKFIFFIPYLKTFWPLATLYPLPPPTVSKKKK